MKYTEPFIAELSDVIITREGKCAFIEYKQENIYSIYLEIGREIDDMTDEEILYYHNAVVKQRAELSRDYKHTAIEITPGKPQIKYFKEGGHWEPRGDILRCQISDGGEDFETTICIDDKELTMKEFGRLLSVYTGWGMRIAMVPEDETHVNPVTQIKDPDGENMGSFALTASACSDKTH